MCRGIMSRAGDSGLFPVSPLSSEDEERYSNLSTPSYDISGVEAESGSISRASISTTLESDEIDSNEQSFDGPVRRCRGKHCVGECCLKLSQQNTPYTSLWQF